MAGADRIDRGGVVRGFRRISRERAAVVALGASRDRSARGVVAVERNRLSQDLLRLAHAGRRSLRQSLRGGGRAVADLPVAERFDVRAGIAHECRRGSRPHRVRAADLPGRGTRDRTSVSRDADIRRAMSSDDLHVRGVLSSSGGPALRDRRAGPLDAHRFICRVRLRRARGPRTHRRRNCGDHR